MSKKNVKPKQKAPTKSRRIMVRLTEEEYDRVLFDAELSGLTVCAYARKRLNGDHPKRRMTEDEITALSSFSEPGATSSVSLVSSRASHMTSENASCGHRYSPPSGGMPPTRYSAEW